MTGAARRPGQLNGIDPCSDGPPPTGYGDTLRAKGAPKKRPPRWNPPVSPAEGAKRSGTTPSSIGPNAASGRWNGGRKGRFEQPEWRKRHAGKTKRT